MVRVRFCRRCGDIVSGKCTRCAAQKNQNLVAPTYDRQWRNVRLKVLADEPLCVDCKAEGKIRPAQEVHHIQTIAAAPHLRLARKNLVPLCCSCHDKRHGKRVHRYGEQNG